jgi:hypothetical protein
VDPQERLRTDADRRVRSGENTPAKSVRIVKIGSFGGRQVASELIAEDLKSHHKTSLTLENVKFDAQLGDADFTPSALSR